MCVGGIDLLPHKLLSSFLTLFRRLHSLFGSRPLELAVAAWLMAAGDHAEPSLGGLGEEPLAVLRLPRNMWRRAPLVEALLLTLRVSMTHLYHKVRARKRRRDGQQRVWSSV